MPRKPHPVKEFVKRISSHDLEIYPDWDLSRSLPRLPVPDLQQTLATYLRLVEPIVSDADEMAETKKCVEEFGKPNGEGERLQAALLKEAEGKENWLSNWWLEDMYLDNPLPLPVNSNPAFVFPSQTFATDREHLRYTAQLIIAILDYKTIIDARGLPVERARHRRKGQPLCMEQYYRLFTSYREPGEPSDRQITGLTADPFDPEHIVVACRDQFFLLEVVNSGSRLAEEDIYNQLRRIVNAAEGRTEPLTSVVEEDDVELMSNGDDEEKDEEEEMVDVFLNGTEACSSQESIGLLTAMHRHRWAAARNLLLKDAVNRENLQLIERCICLVCLDKTVPMCDMPTHIQQIKHPRVQRDSATVLRVLHGMGSSQNGGNRWYDKTMQFVVSRDGIIGLNNEHSVAEGIAVTRLIEHILTYMEEMKSKLLQRFPSICELIPPKPLKWNITKEIRAYIEEARNEIDLLTENLDIYVARYTMFGREFPKTVNMSPDSFIQLALQLAHYKLHGHLVPTYESASIRRFHLGRVDNIRATSLPALEWCRAMQHETSLTDEAKIALLRRAIEWQTEIMVQNILGQGIDNHFLGLRRVASLYNLPEAELFRNSTFRRFHSFRLTTSQVPTTMEAIAGYGPVVASHGYGVAYNPHMDYIVACITAWRSCEATRADKFAEALDETFREMYHLLLNSSKMNSRSIPEEVHTVENDETNK